MINQTRLLVDRLRFLRGKPHLNLQDYGEVVGRLGEIILALDHAAEVQDHQLCSCSLSGTPVIVTSATCCEACEPSHRVPLTVELVKKAVEAETQRADANSKTCREFGRALEQVRDAADLTTAQERARATLSMPWLTGGEEDALPEVPRSRPVG